MKIHKLSFTLLFITCCLFTAAAQADGFDSNSFGDTLQKEVENLSEGEIAGISDELLDEIYQNWSRLEVEMTSLPAKDGLDLMLPIYTNLNVLLQSEAGLTNEIPSLRIIKLTSVIAHLFPEILYASREYLKTLDPESYSYSTRESGLRQAQIGGANMILGAAVSLFTVEQPEPIFIELKSNLWSYGPAIFTQLDQSIRTQVLEYFDKTIETAVRIELQELYTTFLLLLNTDSKV